MTAGVTPITTYYKGFKFRSRTEARWALLLDQIGYSYQYEWEGFSLGRWYLPDFLVEGWIFLEVKPPNPTHAELVLAQQLAFAQQTVVLVVQGQPLPTGEARMFTPDERLPPSTQLHLLSLCLKERFGRGEWVSDQETYNGLIEKAFNVAQQARWEHGEKPSIDKELREAIREMRIPPDVDPGIAMIDRLCDKLLGKEKRP